jgi:two-component system, OmpR family, sensor histidine kinase CiaH
MQEANRLNALCNNMLLASQMEAGDYNVIKEKIELSDIVNECLEDFNIRFPQRKIINQVSQGISIVGDKLQLQMAFNNLLDNAIKYSPKESDITILLVQENNRIEFSVKDEGKGIADDEKEKIFEKFYRTGNTATKMAKGTGLGLYLTKKIAFQHNADIFVKNNTPTGSIFTISFKTTGL